MTAVVTSCDDKLDVTNPNYPTTYDFGYSESDLDEAVIAAYNRLNLDGSYARVGYTLNSTRGEEVWNTTQVWYLPYDNFNVGATDEIGMWVYREFYQLISICNFIIDRAPEASLSDDAYNEIVGQALFLRGLGYYELAIYFQTVPLVLTYSSALTDLYCESATQSEILAQCIEDFTNAKDMLPSRDEGGEWAEGRATCGSAAGYLARTYMFIHEYESALEVLEDIIAGTYGTYALVADYGDNFNEDGENNEESLFEVQFMNNGTGGSTAVWIGYPDTDSTQGHSIEMNYAPDCYGAWGDLGCSVWLYNLFKEETCTDKRLDPRLYWTCLSYESEYDNYTGVSTDAYPDGDPRINEVYCATVSSTPYCDDANGGIGIGKYTYGRAGTLTTAGGSQLCGINVRLMRYSDVLLLAAEASNEINGPTATAIGYINQVRERVALADLELSDFSGNADKLFEQIANVERPKELGCENIRIVDLLRWGFFYDDDRLAQLEEHGWWKAANSTDGNITTTLSELTATGNQFEYYSQGHEYLPIYQDILDSNPNCSANSANMSSDNSEEFFANGWTVHPVVDLSE